MTIDQLEKIAWLNRAFYAEKKLKALERLCVRDKERATDISAHYEDVGKGRSDSRKNGVEDSIVALAASGEKYDDALRTYCLLRKEIELAIEQLHDDVLESIFIYRYLDYMTMSEIAQRMRYDERTIQRKHKSGLEKLSPNVMVCHP